MLSLHFPGGFTALPIVPWDRFAIRFERDPLEDGMAQLEANGAISSLNLPGGLLARSVACLMARTHVSGLGFLVALLAASPRGPPFLA